jgi:hypothetical protein
MPVSSLSLMTAVEGSCSPSVTTYSLAGKPGFYAKCGYKQIGGPIMIGPDNTQEGVRIMSRLADPSNSNVGLFCAFVM